MKAAQKSAVRDADVHRYAAAMSARSAPKRTALPRYPSPAESAVQY